MSQAKLKITGRSLAAQQGGGKSTEAVIPEVIPRCHGWWDRAAQGKQLLLPGSSRSEYFRGMNKKHSPEGLPPARPCLCCLEGASREKQPPAMNPTLLGCPGIWGKLLPVGKVPCAPGMSGKLLPVGRVPCAPSPGIRGPWAVELGGHSLPRHAG